MYRFLIVSAIFAIFAIVAFYPQWAQTRHTFLFLNMENQRVLPKSFRKIPDLLASGSGQFSEKGLEVILENLPSSNIRVVDLREESHGFVDGMAIGWYADKNSGNLGKTLNEIEQDEITRLDDLLKEGAITVYTRDYMPFNVLVTDVATEKEVSTKYKLDYIRIPVTDHRKANNIQIDRFVEMVKKLPEGTWLHFHCLAGRGRTTTFMSMLDMMRHAGKDSLESIAERQHAAGGLDILKPPNPYVWKYPYIVERIEFVKKFYLYCQEVPNFDISWSEWSNK
jgi:hypothetical protein